MSSRLGRSRDARVFIGLLALLFPAIAGAASLASDLHRFIDSHGFPTSREFVEVVTPIVQRLALRGVDFPVAATGPSVLYRFNYELGVPERLPASLGPILAERSDTVGKGRIDLEASYLRADVTDFNGENFGKKIVTAGIRSAPGLVAGQAFVGKDFSLLTETVSLSGSFGLTDAWDVNVLLPFVWTSVRLDGFAASYIQTPSGVRTDRVRVAFDEGRFGVGDLLLRTKYRFLETSLVALAGALTLRVPTGDDGNFQGIGDVSLTPTLVASRTLSGGHDLHGSLGLEFNADDLERSRARYALGASVQVSRRCALLLDLIGSSSFLDDEFAIPAPTGKVFPVARFGLRDLVRSLHRTEVIAFVPRSDVVDFAPGLKVELFGKVVGFVSAILPVTDDGLRANVIGSVGLEANF